MPSPGAFFNSLSRDSPFLNQSAMLPETMSHQPDNICAGTEVVSPAELQWSLFGAPEQFEHNAAQSCYN